jgi:hypothetical protein
VFAVHRFAAVATTEQTFVPRATATKRALTSAFRVWRSEHVSQIRIRFDGPAADEIRERRWLAKQEIVEEGGERRADTSP